MRRITLWTLSTLAAVLLLLSYRTSTMGPAGTPPSGLTALTEPGGHGPGPGSTPRKTAAPKGSPSSGRQGSFRGGVAQTRWGPVQVAVTVAGDRITDIRVLASPTGNRHSQDINAYALPILREHALAAQTADIDAVSGATVTSNGYRASLQAAIDAARR